MTRLKRLPLRLVLIAPLLRKQDVQTTGLLAIRHLRLLGRLKRRELGGMHLWHRLRPQRPRTRLALWGIRVTDLLRSRLHDRLHRLL